MSDTDDSLEGAGSFNSLDGAGGNDTMTDFDVGSGLDACTITADPCNLPGANTEIETDEGDTLAVVRAYPSRSSNRVPLLSLVALCPLIPMLSQET